MVVRCGLLLRDYFYDWSPISSFFGILHLIQTLLELGVCLIQKPTGVFAQQLKPRVQNFKEEWQ